MLRGCGGCGSTKRVSVDDDFVGIKGAWEVGKNGVCDGRIRELGYEEGCVGRTDLVILANVGLIYLLRMIASGQAWTYFQLLES